MSPRTVGTAPPAPLGSSVCPPNVGWPSHSCSCETPTPPSAAVSDATHPHSRPRPSHATGARRGAADGPRSRAHRQGLPRDDARDGVRGSLPPCREGPLHASLARVTTGAGRVSDVFLTPRVPSRYPSHEEQRRGLEGGDGDDASDSLAAHQLALRLGGRLRRMAGGRFNPRRGRAAGH